MATQILMPALSPTMEEGTLAKWLVKEGDAVKSGQVIAEIETDKATMEFEAVDEGIVGRILVAEGTGGVKVNTPIAVLVEEGESVSDAPAPAAAAPAAAAATVAAESRAEARPTAAAPVAGARVFASPLARRIAKEKGLDLASVKGSGPHGRIVRADVEGAKAAPAAVAAPAVAAAAPAPAKAAMPAGMAAETVLKMYADRDFTEVALDGMRRTIAARLTEAKQTIPHFYLRREVRLDALMAFREQHHQGLCDCLAGSAGCQCRLGRRQDPEAEALGRGRGGGGGGRAFHAGPARRPCQDAECAFGRDEGPGNPGQDQEAGAA